MKFPSPRILDSLLRGEINVGDRTGSRADLIVWQILLAAVYGMCLGIFALGSRESPDPRFLLLSAVKFPVLLMGTTLVTFPSLYVFLALFRVRLTFVEVLGAALAANTVIATVAASLGPILGFFALTSQSYPFLLLLNVMICLLAGILGFRLLFLAMKPASTPGPPPLPAENVPEESAGSGLRGFQAILLIWLLLYGFVGTQMSWILRPFIGDPKQEFVLFRGRDGSFVDAVGRALNDTMSGDSARKTPE
jgi:hypothetical protein